MEYEFLGYRTNKLNDNLVEVKSFFSINRRVAYAVVLFTKELYEDKETLDYIVREESYKAATDLERIKDDN